MTKKKLIIILIILAMLNISILIIAINLDTYSAILDCEYQSKNIPLEKEQVDLSIETPHLLTRDILTKEDLIKDEELDMLAHLINAECGAEWCQDEMLYYTGSVVLNRIKSKDFPDTMKEVIFQKGQYSCTWNGSYKNLKPTKRCVNIAKRLLTYGSVLPENVVFQANFKQGLGVYAQVQNMYFCYR